MSQQPQRRLLQEPKRRWQWPLDLASYDRAPLLSHAEQQALDQFVVLSEHVIPSPSQRLALSSSLSDESCAHRHGRRRACMQSGRVVSLEANAPPKSRLLGLEHHRVDRDPLSEQCSLWSPASCQRSLLPAVCSRRCLPAVQFHTWHGPWHGALSLVRHQSVWQASSFAGHQARQRSLAPMGAWHRWGDLPPKRTLETAGVESQPTGEDLTSAFLDQIRQGTMGLKDGMPMVSRALVDLGILERPLPLKNEAPRFGKWIETADVAPDWVDYCNRWYATTTASLRTTKPLYYRMLRIRRWVTAFHPEMASPLDWTREMAAECAPHPLSLPEGRCAPRLCSWQHHQPSCSLDHRHPTLQCQGAAHAFRAASVARPSFSSNNAARREAYPDQTGESV